MAFPVRVILPGFPLLLELSSQGPRGLCNKVLRVPWESRKCIKSQGPLEVRRKWGPDSHNHEYPASDHTNNRSDSLTRPDRATDGHSRSAAAALPREGALQQWLSPKLSPAFIRSCNKYLPRTGLGPCPWNWKCHGEQDSFFTVSGEAERKGRALHAYVYHRLQSASEGPGTEQQGFHVSS